MELVLNVKNFHFYKVNIIMRILTVILALSLSITTAFAQQGYYNLGNLHCIGDSLTDGAGCSPGMGGYRKPLYNDLVKHHYNFNFVGNLQTWPGGSWPAGWHDGHGGWTTDDICNGRGEYGPASNWVSNFNTDTIVLMCGRNDPWDWPDRDFILVYNKYNNLINSIYQQRPNVVVYWSNVFMSADGYTVHCEMQDAAIKQVIIDQKALYGRNRIYYIDSYRGLGNRLDIFSDGVHLNDFGYGLLEKIIFRKILKTTPRIILPKP